MAGAGGGVQARACMLKRIRQPHCALTRFCSALGAAWTWADGRPSGSHSQDAIGNMQSLWELPVVLWKARAALQAPQVGLA